METIFVLGLIGFVVLTVVVLALSLCKAAAMSDEAIANDLHKR